MNWESKNKCTVLDGTGILIVIVNFLRQMGLYMKGGEILSPPHTVIESSHKHDGKLSILSGLRKSCVALTK